ncbi:MAG TPA: response regulator [Candidatus Saccharimonadales bacterium]|nr:response regulator [Candidatus Saccharimonadales bacterium]
MTGAKILIVEDDTELNGAYKMILESAGHDVATAEGGEAALSHLENAGDPSIIFLDLKMPGMDGIDFLKKYNLSNHTNTDVILFSNYDSQKEVDQAYELGVERYILKARASPGELIRIVENVLANRAR